jgi:hypothetical protein
MGFNRLLPALINGEPVEPSYFINSDLQQNSYSGCFTAAAVAQTFLAISEIFREF